MRIVSIFVPLAIATLLMSPLVAIATPMIRSMPQNQAQGLSGNGAQISVWPGSGTNIDFTRTGETIHRAWLDDPSQLTIDFDSNLEAGASLIHLRRVTGISFPNLPATPTTLLTVVTQSADGRKVYLFKVGYGSGEARYASVVITPEGYLQGADLHPANWQSVERGLQQSVAQGLIESNSPVIERTQAFLARVRNGMPLHQAIAQSHVSVALISRLAEMGEASMSFTQRSVMP